MKAALCISGELRSYDKTYAELKNNIIDPLGADVFVYSWDAVKGTRKARCQVNKYNRFLVDDFRAHDESKEELLENVKKTYNPRKIELEPFLEEYKNKIQGAQRPKEFIEDPDRERWTRYDLAMFYTLYRCNELKREAEREMGTKYDIVIKTRTDIRFPDFKPIVRTLEKKMVDNILWYWPKDHNEGHVVSDKFAFSNSGVMDYYSSTFNFLNEYWEEGLIVKETNQPKMNEGMLWHHIHNKSDIRVHSFGSAYYDASRAARIKETYPGKE